MGISFELCFGSTSELFAHFVFTFSIIADHSADKKSLEGCDNIVKYIAHRLNWNKDDIEQALNKHRDLLNRSPSKVCLN